MLPLLLLLAVSAGAQSAAQCREANEQAIAAFKATLPEMPEHDRDGAEALIDELERLIKESRAQGVDECVIWQEINRRVCALVAPGEAPRARARPPDRRCVGAVRASLSVPRVPCPRRDTIVRARSSRRR